MHYIPKLCAIALCLIAPITSLSAQIETRRIVYSDLDLRSFEGRRQLDQRILFARQALCGPALSLDPVETNRIRRCLRDTARDALPQRDRAIERAGR